MPSLRSLDVNAVFCQISIAFVKVLHHHLMLSENQNKSFITCKNLASGILDKRVTVIFAVLDVAAHFAKVLLSID